MWTKYDYLCTNCDSLIEVTAEVFRALDPDCICGNGAVIGIGVSPGNAPVIVDPWADVSKVTPPKLVKINTNPYN
jgi:hypothetical protein